MKIRILTIVEAWELYKLVRSHFPKDLDEEIIVLDFMEGFVDSISSEPNLILEISRLLLEDDPSKIDNMTGEQTFLLLVEGFTENSIFELCRFFSEVIKK